MLFQRICGIDLGTDTIKICDKNEKLNVCEKNMLAIRDKVNIIAIGDKAFEIYEKAPANVEAGSPMTHGAIADVKNLEIVLTQLLKRFTGFFSKHPDIILTVPIGISELEKMAFQQLLTGNIKAKRVALVENGLADAVGIGMPVLHSMGNIVVNIGASTTDISVISGGKIVIGKRLHIGGTKLDEDIENMVRRKFDLNIGKKTSEILKNNLSYMIEGVPAQMRAFGIHTLTGLPSSVIISSEDVNEAIIDSIAEIADAIKSVLQRTPPQLSADIHKNGIYLTGGVSQISNLAAYMKRHLETITYSVPEPVFSTIRGLVQIMNDSELRKLTFSVKEFT